MKQVTKLFALAVLATPLFAAAQPVTPRQRTPTLHDRSLRVHDRTPTLRAGR